MRIARRRLLAEPNPPCAPRRRGDGPKHLVTEAGVNPALEQIPVERVRLWREVTLGQPLLGVLTNGEPGNRRGCRPTLRWRPSAKFDELAFICQPAFGVRPLVEGVGGVVTVPAIANVRRLNAPVAHGAELAP